MKSTACLFVVLIVMCICSCSGSSQEDDTSEQVPGGTGASQTDSITQFGITWTFDRPYEAGQFANGDWWVRGDPTVILVDIDPHSFEGDGVRLQDGDSWVVAAGRVVNGSMLNIDSTNPAIGYDSSVTTFVYDEALNVARSGGAPISSSNPLVVQPPSSLVSTISLD